MKTAQPLPSRRVFPSCMARARCTDVDPDAVIEGAGHDMTWLKPDVVNRVTLDFLDRGP